MTATLVIVAVLVGLALGIWPWLAMARHRREWYRARPNWWTRRIDGPALRLSVRPVGAPSPHEVVSLRDPRVVSTRVKARRVRPDVFRVDSVNPLKRRTGRDRRAARKVAP